jgi:hypothetical protein
LIIASYNKLQIKGFDKICREEADEQPTMGHSQDSKEESSCKTDKNGKMTHHQD